MLVTKFFYKFIVLLFNLFVLIVKCEEKDLKTYGGVNVDIRTVPYTESTSNGCTGALIRPQWFLSAAHCFVNGKWIGMTIGLGSSHRTNNYYNIGVEKVDVHPQYGQSSYFVTQAHYDIADAKLARRAVLSEYVKLLELEETGWPSGVNLRDCTLAGFGWNMYLQKDTRLHWSRFFFTLGCNCVRSKNIVCTITANDGDDSPCYGDSGSVVVCNYKGVAITSSHLVSSSHCNWNGTNKLYGTKDGFTLFTNIHRFLPWIKHILHYEPHTYLKSKAIGLVTMKGIQYYDIITMRDCTLTGLWLEYVPRGICLSIYSCLLC